MIDKRPNPWKCNTTNYSIARFGETYYPTSESERFIEIYFENFGRISYRKVNFVECLNPYRPDQTGDTDDDS